MTVKKTSRNKKHRSIIFHATVCLGIVFIYFYSRIVEWFKTTFNVGIEQILFTINSPLKGGNMKIFSSLRAFISIRAAAVLVFFYAVCSILYEFVFSKLKMRITISAKKKSIFSIDVYRALRSAIWFILIALLVNWTIKAFHSLNLENYISSKQENSTLYENFYHQPQAAAVKGSGKNLIWIYLESMEIAYASKADGGFQPTRNCIPHLTALAQENINFSTNKGFGGFRPANGATWTMGALFSTSSGIPFAFPIGGNQQNLYEIVGKNVITLGDILNEKGYVQEFLCGSDGDFAGRKQFFEQHGKYEVFDLFTAREKGYVGEDYHVWWGALKTKSFTASRTTN